MATRLVHYRSQKYRAKTIPVTTWLLDKITTETSGYDLWSTQIKPFTLIQPDIQKIVEDLKLPRLKHNIMKTKLYHAWASSRKFTSKTLERKIEEIFTQMDLWLITEETKNEHLDRLLKRVLVEFKVADEKIV